MIFYKYLFVTLILGWRDYVLVGTVPMVMRKELIMGVTG
jgi:hypothetical protein